MHSDAIVCRVPRSNPMTTTTVQKPRQASRQLEKRLRVPEIDFAAFVPREMRNLTNPQTDIPRIAKDARLVRLVDSAIKEIPTQHAIKLGDARKLSSLAPESVHLVVT